MAVAGWRNAWSRLEDGESDDRWRAAEAGGARWVALQAAPEEVTRRGELPAEGVLSQAPLGDYDVIELSVFAQPAARVRWFVDDDGAGAVSAVVPVGAASVAAASEAALVEAALDELWQEGAETVTTLVPEARAADYESAGWVRLEVVAEA